MNEGTGSSMQPQDPPQHGPLEHPRYGAAPEQAQQYAPPPTSPDAEHAAGAQWVPCQICGRVPTAVLSLRRFVGMLIITRIFHFKGPLCRDHGIEASRDFLKRTMILGWWGFVTFFANLVVIPLDLYALSKAKKLDPPYDPPAPGGAPPISR